MYSTGLSGRSNFNISDFSVKEIWPDVVTFHLHITSSTAAVRCISYLAQAFISLVPYCGQSYLLSYDSSRASLLLITLSINTRKLSVYVLTEATFERNCSTVSSHATKSRTQICSGEKAGLQQMLNEPILYADINISYPIEDLRYPRSEKTKRKSHPFYSGYEIPL